MSSLVVALESSRGQTEQQRGTEELAGLLLKAKWHIPNGLNVGDCVGYLLASF